MCLLLGWGVRLILMLCLRRRLLRMLLGALLLLLLLVLLLVLLMLLLSLVLLALVLWRTAVGGLRRACLVGWRRGGRVGVASPRSTPRVVRLVELSLLCRLCILLTLLALLLLGDLCGEVTAPLRLWRQWRRRTRLHDHGQVE